MSYARLRVLVLALPTAVLLQGCGLLRPFGDALVALCEQEEFVTTRFDDTHDGACSPDDCSLREAVITANACPGPDRIVLSPGTYLLTRAGADEDAARTGDLDITDHVEIVGNGAVIDGGALDRVFDVHAEVAGERLDVVMGDLTVRNGNSSHGAGIRNRGFLQANRVRVVQNRSGSHGAYYNGGESLFTNGEVSDNVGSGDSGAGVWNAGHMDMIGSTFARNRVAQEHDDEPAMSYGVVNDGTMTLRGSTFIANNDANDQGVGLSAGMTLGLSTSIEVTDTTFEGHSWRGIYQPFDTSTLILRDSTIRDNPGGAIDVWGTATLDRVTLNGNGASAAYGADTCSMSEVYGTLTLTTSTITGNRATRDDCVLFRNYGVLNLEFVTLYENGMAGVANDPRYIAHRAPQATLMGALLGLNVPANCQGEGFTSLGYNLADEDSCNLGTQDLVLSGTDFLLAPLAPGGSTFSATALRALLPGSPAVNIGGERCPELDQRLQRRPQGPACDVGAYEQLGIPLEGPTAFAPTVVIPPTPTPGPVPLSAPVGTFSQNANCRRGPGTVYSVVTSLLLGQQVQIEGQSSGEPRWWLILLPESTARCWVSSSTIDVEGPLDQVPVVAAPPTPTPTPQAAPPAAPQQLHIAGEVCNAQVFQVTLGWLDAADNEQGYRVFRDGQLIATLGPNATSYTDTTPSYSGHTYGVEAFNAAGASNRPTVLEDGCVY